MSAPTIPAAVGDAAKAFLGSPRKMLIGGEWRDALSGARMDVRDPATGEVVATVPAAEAADVDAAVRAARAAFESAEWSAARPVDRERWLLKLADLLEAKPFLSHSLRAVTRLAPNWIGVPIWAIVSAIVLWYTVRAWKSRAPLRVRLGVVVLASALVNPHMIVYDLTVLALPLVWFGAYMQEPARRDAGPYWMLVYWLFVTTFMPTAAAIGVQLSVFVMAALLMVVSRAVHAEAGALNPAHPNARLAA